MFSWNVALEEDASMMASALGRGLHVVVGICEIFSWGSLKLNLRMKHLTYYCASFYVGLVLVFS